MTKMSDQTSTTWSASQSAEMYAVEGWGNDYFGVSSEGLVTVRTKHTEVPLMDIVEGMVERDLHMPVLLRIENFLDAQLFRLNTAFRNAIAKLNYKGEYRGVYPIKVNQQAQVVEEIAAFGSRFKHGLEVGSKPEMIAALAMLEEHDSLIICNGYKDQEFIELGLQAIKQGMQCFFVIETPAELGIIIDRSRALGIEPRIGVRAKMASKVSGHWHSTSGDRSVFGLTSTQLIVVIETLRRESMLHCLQLLHCHLSSQIPALQEIRNGVTEACRFYIDLVREGAALTHIDLGGGLAVDYTGAQSSGTLSRNYDLEEYCEAIVDTINTTLNPADIAHPIIVTESGRATVAYSSILLFNILDSTSFAPVPVAHHEVAEHPMLNSMREILTNIEPRRLSECFTEAHFYRRGVRELFKHGYVDLRARAVAENLFLEILQRIADMVDTLDHVPEELLGLRLSLADIYYGNFSLFQSLPDVWAIDQLFPVMPIHRLDEKPSRQAVIADITCDCDGKIDKFIAMDGVNSTLPVHDLIEGEAYYIGVFLVGAYQETLGDLHNLFGDTNVVSVRLEPGGKFHFVKEIHGDTIADVLSYVEYDPREMLRRYRSSAERAVREGRISANDRQQMIKRFSDSLQGYTYYEGEA